MNRWLAWPIASAVLVVLACLAGGTAAFGYSHNLNANAVVWMWGYEGDTHPTNEFPFGGSKWNLDAQGADGAHYVTAEGFVVDTGVSGNGMGFRLSQNATTWLPTSIGTFEFRMRILSSNANYVGGIEVRQPTFAAGFLAHATTNSVQLAATGGGPAATYPIGNDWNTYRITMDGTNSALYLNQSTTPILQTSGTRGNGTTIEFGDYGAFGPGAVVYDYIRWTWAGAFPPPPKGTVFLLK